MLIARTNMMKITE